MGFVQSAAGLILGYTFFTFKKFQNYKRRIAFSFLLPHIAWQILIILFLAFLSIFVGMVLHVYNGIHLGITVILELSIATALLIEIWWTNVVLNCFRYLRFYNADAGPEEPLDLPIPTHLIQETAIDEMYSMYAPRICSPGTAMASGTEQRSSNLAYEVPSDAPTTIQIRNGARPEAPLMSSTELETDALLG